MKKDNVPKIYEIDIHEECIYKGDLLVPLLSFCDEKIQTLVNDEYYSYFDEAIKELPNMKAIDKKIEEYLKFYGIPYRLLFVLTREYSGLAYITEVFTGIEIKANKELLRKHEISQAKANFHLMNYSYRELEGIANIMLNIKEQTKRFDCKIIDFESYRKKRSR